MWTDSSHTCYIFQAYQTSINIREVARKVVVQQFVQGHHLGAALRD